MLAYNEAIDLEVMEQLKALGLKDYTKITSSFGRGQTSGAHLGNDVWPGRNNILYVACQDDKAEELISSIKNLRVKLGREGLKAFSWSLEEIT